RLKRTVPAPTTLLFVAVRTGGFAFASMTKTSRSGSESATRAFQLRLISSTQFVPLNLTMRPVAGAPDVEPGGGGGMPPFGVTSCSLIDVVRLPDSKPAA